MNPDKKLNDDIVRCRRCPRLIAHCKSVASEKRKSFQSETYWGKPIANFGDANAEILIVGLAPAAHGANRTSRMFTGDRSGQWLYRALYRAGLANQSTYEYADDGLQLKNCLITAVAHCAPPDNKPSPDEIAHCEEYLARTFALKPRRVVIALGGIAWNAVFKYLKEKKLWLQPKPKFSHGAEVYVGDQLIIGSYHPSQQNTFTGRLTEDMFDAIFSRAQAALAAPISTTISTKPF